ncbi:MULTISPECIES: hypothetical protein [unclassified Corynebacterium]|uniref:hypothetical protein n=1 Tax=unclassified Corynebacterium TaxID=2624378 RepID=UPI0029C9E261|nr:MULTISPECIES: hypothetical protein [unclassified Corynebacterium]WPF66286.1 hypothetical protein OLX12_00715 [Corynebacterium sp. 22KM0430]WPF68776.1 hypothetical protein OLW90_00715 [Corynebacterium sp. 21KM1197]
MWCVTSLRPTPTSTRLIWLYGAIAFLVGAVVRVVVMAIFARANEDSLGGLMMQWDTHHYERIAERGYFAGPTIDDVPPEHRLLAFFPAIPLLMRLGHALTGLEYDTVGMVFNVFFGVAMAAGVAAIAARMGAGRRGMIGAAFVVTSAPMAVTFSMPYTEALFGALAFWALVAMMDRRWWLAGLLIFAAGFVRLTAVDLVAVLAVMVVLYGRTQWRAWVALALSPLSALGYVWWASSHTSEVGGYFGLQKEGWHTGFDFGVASVKFAWNTLMTSQELGYFLSVAVMIAALVALALAWGKGPLPLWLFAAALSANILLSDGIMHSRPRLLLPAAIVLVPLVLGWGKRVSGRAYAVGIGAWVLVGAWFSGYMLAVFPWAI